MSRQNEKVTINVDNQTLEVEKGLTILQAAERHDIYIPTLCAHQDLTPFGGCRLCIVEVDGMRGFPTACTTPVEEGMVIRTHTAQVQAVRREILQLILSEHTSSCLICEEKDECKEFMGTIRKSGMITGCRYCPNDGKCELQEVVEKLGVENIDYPIYYRNLRVERDDPFYDRDYNLCILCGRCIRMCQEIRTANTLAFKQRGSQTIIGPAYDRTHLDSGCEFCGACVSVCPTGALSEKARKWEGEAEREELTTCALCGVGCQMLLQIKGDRVIGSLPAEDRLVNNGQLCVKGRFCVTELVNHHQRLRRPYKTQGHTKVEMPWDEAIGLAAEKLSVCSSENFGMLVSPNCSTEDLYAAQKFARVAMSSHNIDTSVRAFYGSGFSAYLDLMKMSVPLSDVRNASAILCIGLDARFGRSVVGVELRKALRRGAKIITIHPRHHSLSVVAHAWIQPVPGTEVDLLRSLVTLTGKGKTGSSKSRSKGKSGSVSAELSTVAKTLKEDSSPVILVGSEFLQYGQSKQILEAVKELAVNVRAGILPLPAQNNLYGTILMGTHPELLPGGFSSSDKKRAEDLGKRWGTKIPPFSFRFSAETLSSEKKLKMLYLIGEVPTVPRPPCDFLIFQNIYPSGPGYEADLVLPSAAFTEADGTFINGEGRIQRVRKAVDPPGEALPDWEILCRIADKMGKSGFGFSSAEEIHDEISSLVKGFGDFHGSARKPNSLTCEGNLSVPKARSRGVKKTDKKFPLLLNVSIVENAYRGFPLSVWVEGAKKVFPEGIVDVSTEDAREAEISDGDGVVVTSAHFERTWPARIVSEQRPGTLHVTLRQGEAVGPNPHPVRIRKKNV